MKTRFCLVIGDLYGCGHERSESFPYTINRTKAKLEQAYKRSVDLLNTNLIENICADFEDDEIPQSLIEDIETKLTDPYWKKRLDKLKKDDLQLHDNKSRKGPLQLSISGFAELYLIFTSCGDQEIRAEPIEEVKIDAGGYGLFF